MKNVTPSKFLEIIKKGYSLDILYILELIKEAKDISFLTVNSLQAETIIQSLVRKGLVTSEHKLTIIGQDLLNFFNNLKEEKFVKTKVNPDDFELWWKTFPATDNFKYKERTFTGSRGLKKSKDECKLKFNKILLEGDYTALQLIKALETEIKQKMENSISTGTNKLSFMQGTVPYLNQRTYESFIDLIDLTDEQLSIEVEI
jgi:hypothetical protein